jgi:hypothetical protein
MAIEQALECLTKILQNVKPISDLHRLGSAFGRAIGIDPCTVAANHLDAWVLAKPLFDDTGRALRQEVEHRMSFEIDDQCAVGVAFAPCPVVNPDDGGSRRCRSRRSASQAKQGICAGGHAGAGGSAGTRFAAMLKGKMALILSKAVGALSEGGNDGGETLSEDGARANGIVADEFADEKAEANGNTCPGSISNGARVAAMEARRGLGAEGTGSSGLAWVERDGNRGCIGVEVDYLQLSSSGEQYVGKHSVLLRSTWLNEASVSLIVG